jgi:hypothetical protein
MMCHGYPWRDIISLQLLCCEMPLSEKGTPEGLQTISTGKLHLTGNSAYSSDGCLITVFSNQYPPFWNEMKSKPAKSVDRSMFPGTYFLLVIVHVVIKMAKVLFVLLKP